MNYAIDSAINGKTLMEVSTGFGETMKMFFCRLDDAFYTKNKT